MNRRWLGVASRVVFLALSGLGWGCGVPGSASRTARASAAPARPLLSLRFGRRTAGCGDALVFTTNDGLTEVLGVGASREALRLTPSPKSFRIEGRPPGLTVWVDVYPKKPEILTECTDLIQQPPLPVKWSATRGLVTLSVSKENPAPPPLECYTVDITLQNVAFAMPGGRAEAVLERLELTGVTVGAIAPYPCQR